MPGGQAVGWTTTRIHTVPLPFTGVQVHTDAYTHAYADPTHTHTCVCVQVCGYTQMRTYMPIQTHRWIHVSTCEHAHAGRWAVPLQAQKCARPFGVLRLPSLE